MGRILALDWGTRRIGVALSDESKTLATPFTTFPTKPREKLLAAIHRLVEEEDVEQVIIGLPVNMDGSEGASAAAARELGEQLARAGLRTEYHDERLSSFEAELKLRQAGRKPSRDKGRIDRAAAALILQGYLDELNTGPGGKKD